MKKILLIDDGSAAAANAAKVAQNIALHLKATITCANFSTLNKAGKVYAGYQEDDTDENLRSIPTKVFSRFVLDDFARFIIKNEIWMIIQGLADNDSNDKRSINIRSVLHRVQCPLLLVPENYQFNGFNRIDYVTDLRYCRLNIALDMALLARAYHARLSLSHVSAKGIPHMHEPYALEVFRDSLGDRISYEGLYFNPINERDMVKVADVLIHSMGTDLLVLANHRFHFEELFGAHLPEVLPPNLQIPIMVYPS